MIAHDAETGNALPLAALITTGIDQLVLWVHTAAVNGQPVHFVAGRGWLACNRLKVGDRLLSESGAWVTVEEVEDTGIWATVYNLRVADHHTYFVGDAEEWGFSVWRTTSTPATEALRVLRGV